MAIIHKDLALAIIEFLESSVVDKTVSEEFAESIDVAVDCIADAFEVDKADAQEILSKFGNKNLLEAVNSGFPGSSKVAKSPVKEIDEETKAKAESLKAKGNKAMSAKNFAEAIAKYTEAISLDKSNVVYLSNRAAAYSSALQHDQAVSDAEAAITLNPSFSKAYSRLGLAQYALGNAQAAMNAYKQGLEIEGPEASDAMKSGYETAKRRVEEDLESSISRAEPACEKPTPNDSSTPSAGVFPDLSSIFGGGMPNFSEMMNNPQVMQAAQSLMSNPAAMEGLMSNPMLRNMAQSIGGDSGLSGLMNNPELQNMAKSFMGNQRKNTNGTGNSDDSAN